MVDDERDGSPADTRSRGRFGRRRGRPRRKAAWWELPVLLVAAVAVAVLLKTFVVQPFVIPSESMERTLHGCTGCSGDRILTFKPVYSVARDPHPGDIVVFRDPGGWDPDAVPTPPSNPVLHGLAWVGQFIGLVPPYENDLVKRVIAVGGQTVKCCDASGNVQVGNDGPDGTFRSLDDASYTYLSTGDPSAGQVPFGPVTVPAGRLWVMGDHRDASADSRYHCGNAPSSTGAVCSGGSRAVAMSSTVPVDDVLGKAVVIAWPVSRWTTLGTPPTFEDFPLPASAGAPATRWPPAAGLTAVLALGVVERQRQRGRRIS
ncbi:signal peptidase I [Jatrophihabitans sp. YIM 134969]